MKHFAAVMASAAVLGLLLPAGGALGSVNCSGSYCDVTTDSIEYRYFPNNAVTMQDYGVATDGGGKHVVFALIQAGLFETAEPDEDGRTVSIVGSRAFIETHDSAHATLILRASQPGDVTFTLDSGMGVLPLGSRAIIGDSELLADMAVTEGRTLRKSMDNLIVSLQPNDTLTFRAQGPLGSLGQMLALGNLDAELDVRSVGLGIDSDLTAFERNAAMTVESISSGRASFTFSSTRSSPAFIVDLSENLYAPLKENIAVDVDGQELSRFDSIDDFLAGSETGFVVAEGQDYAEMLVRPGLQSGSLTIESTDMNLLLTFALLSSVCVCVAAAVFLFRRRTI